MEPKPAERRSSDLRMPLPAAYERLGDRRSRAESSRAKLFEAGGGFYSVEAIAEFIQYEIDGSAQTTRNELFVTPLCLVAIEVDALPGCRDEAQRRALREAVEEALRRTTRVADRVARSGDHYVSLLRRTIARNVHVHYSERLSANVNDATGKLDVRTTLSVGIASLVEHVVRNPDDMVRKAFRALEEARKQPGSSVIYDFRVMPLD